MARSLEQLLADSERRVWTDEQRSNTRRLALWRVLVAALGLVAVLAEDGAAVTKVACAVYLVVGGAILVASRLDARLSPWLPWAVPLFDVPLVAFTEWSRLREGAAPMGIVATAACLDLGFVVLVSLALSTRVVVVTAVAGFAAFTFISFSSGLDVRELDLALGSFAVTAALIAWSTSRFLPLALELRRQAWAGRYKVGPRLGAGGMAEVFVATHRREDGVERKVALKRILPALAERADMQQLFLRELELSRLMSHPHIVQVLDSGADETGPFLVMEFVEGTTLHRLLKRAHRRGERLPAEACFELSEQLLRAVEHIHTRRDAQGTPLGLMHRDLNPPNVLVTFDGELKVADFGIARPQLEGGMTNSGELRGKAVWAAPEQLAGEPQTPAIDLFAAGLICVEVALGRHLTDGLPPTRELVRAALETLPAQRPELGGAWWAMVTSLLEPDVTRRCPDASTALAALRGLRWNAAEARAALARLATETRDGRDEGGESAMPRTLTR